MHMKIKQKQTLTIVSVLAALSMSYPFLSIANRSQTIAGFPALFLYFFAMWFAIILAMMWFSERRYSDKEIENE